MIDQNKILITGGSGLLGGEIRKLLPNAAYPGREEFDVTDRESMERYVSSKKFSLCLHAAAFTSPPKVEQSPERAIAANIIGTANVVRLCMKFEMRLVYISTDYVFRGDRGMYREDDPVVPVNRYAWSKLGGECSARLYDRSLIIRTSFGPNEFPYEKAFVDQWTSREPVRVIAKKIVAVLDTDATGTIHIGGARKTVYEYAKSLDPKREVGQLSLTDVPVVAPKDTSLDCSKYDKLMNRGNK
ncbi:MAG: sugar nucleotide-binding protein [Candidatus Omnitrophota bacterium]